MSLRIPRRRHRSAGARAARRRQGVRLGRSRCGRARWSSTPAPSTPWSARTAPASRRWSRSWPGSTSATRASSGSSGEDVDFNSTAAVQGGRHRGDLPGADALPRPVGHREHLHGPPAARPRPAGSTGPRCTPRPSALFDRLGVRIDPRRPALGLSIADQQIIEIAKAISLDASLLIMDEPTAALSGVEVDRLFAVARSLRDEGRALVFISHRFDEVFALCDTVTVMRDGDTSPPTPSRTPASTRSSTRMVGREVGDLFPKTPAEIGDVVLEVERTAVARHLPRRHLHRAGRRDRRPGRAGRRRPQRDRPRRLRGRPLRRRHGHRGGRKLPPAQPAGGDPGRHGFIPEDRRKQGLITERLGRPQRRQRHPRRPDHARPAHQPRREPRRRSLGRPSSRSRPTPSTWPPAP